VTDVKSGNKSFGGCRTGKETLRGVGGKPKKKDHSDTKNGKKASWEKAKTDLLRG